MKSSRGVPGHQGSGIPKPSLTSIPGGVPATGKSGMPPMNKESSEVLSHDGGMPPTPSQNDNIAENTEE